MLSHNSNALSEPAARSSCSSHCRTLPNTHNPTQYILWPVSASVLVHHCRVPGNAVGSHRVRFLVPVGRRWHGPTEQHCCTVAQAHPDHHPARSTSCKPCFHPAHNHPKMAASKSNVQPIGALVNNQSRKQVQMPCQHCKYAGRRPQPLRLLKPHILACQHSR